MIESRHRLVVAAVFFVSACAESLPVAPAFIGLQNTSSEHPQKKELTESILSGLSNTGSHPTNARRARFTYTEQTALLSREISFFNGEMIGYLDIQYSGTQATRSITYEGAGVDNTWFTPDDMVIRYVDLDPITPSSVSITYDGPGPDGIWFNEDDRVKYYLQRQVGAIGDEVETVISIVGDDGIWFTPDDKIGWITRKSAINLNTQEVAVYTSPGADNDWSTYNDNFVYQHWSNTFDATSQLIRHILYADVGSDGVAFTEDDNVIYYHDYNYDTLGRIENSIMYHGGPGPDNIWFTADDNIHSCKLLTRDVNDLPILTTTTRTGPDLSCFTGDDLVWGYHDDTFNNLNQLERSTAYYGSGPDSIWFNADDLIVSQREYLSPN